VEQYTLYSLGYWHSTRIENEVCCPANAYADEEWLASMLLWKAMPRWLLQQTEKKGRHIAENKLCTRPAHAARMPKIRLQSPRPCCIVNEGAFSRPPFMPRRKAGGKQNTHAAQRQAGAVRLPVLRSCAEIKFANLTQDFFRRARR
jgi:hypothetical protein